MSVTMSSEVWKIPHLSSAEKLLLLAIADISDDEGVCYYSADTIRKKCGWSSTATYTKYITILKDAGLIVKVPRASTLKGRKTNKTILNHSNIHTGEVMDRLRVSREKFRSRSSMNSHGRRNGPNKAFSPQEFTRGDNSTYAPVPGGENCEDAGFDLEAETKEIDRQLSEYLSPGTVQ